MAEKRKDKDGRILPDNVIQRKDDTYMWKKMIDGKQYCEYANTLGEIKQKRNKALYEIEQGTYKNKKEKKQAAEEKSKYDITLNEWFFQWEKAYRQGKLKSSSLHTEHSKYMSAFSDTIGKENIKNIRAIDITMLYNKMSNDGYAYSTITRCNSILITMFDDAMSNGIVEGNPARGAVKISKTLPEERHALSVNEQKRFFDFIENHPVYNKYLPFFSVGFGTGLRIGEILGLTWNDIDFERNIISVNHTLMCINDYATDGKMRYHINSPKTKTSNREVPMIPNVSALLLELKNNGTKSDYCIDGYSDFVFLSKAGKPYLQAKIREKIKNIVIQINKEEDKRTKDKNKDPLYFEYFSPHCMRHTFATRCYENGVKIKAIQKMLGHNSIKMTMDIYTHLDEDTMVQEIQHIKDIV